MSCPTDKTLSQSGIREAIDELEHSDLAKGDAYGARCEVKDCIARGQPAYLMEYAKFQSLATTTESRFGR